MSEARICTNCYVTNTNIPIPSDDEMKAYRSIYGDLIRYVPHYQGWEK